MNSGSWCSGTWNVDVCCGMAAEAVCNFPLISLGMKTIFWRSVKRRLFELKMSNENKNSFIFNAIQAKETNSRV